MSEKEAEDFEAVLKDRYRGHKNYIRLLKKRREQARKMLYQEKPGGGRHTKSSITSYTERIQAYEDMCTEISVIASRTGVDLGNIN